MKRFNRGFTLIEVLVSVAVLALVLTILLRMEINSVSLAAKNHIGLQSLSLVTNETDRLLKTGFDGTYTNNFETDPFSSAGSLSIGKDEMTESFDENRFENYSAKAEKEQRADILIPMDVMTCQILYGNTDYAEIKTFTIRFF